MTIFAPNLPVAAKDARPSTSASIVAARPSMRPCSPSKSPHATVTCYRYWISVRRFVEVLIASSLQHERRCLSQCHSVQTNLEPAHSLRLRRCKSSFLFRSTPSQLICITVSLQFIHHLFVRSSPLASNDTGNKSFFL